MGKMRFAINYLYVFTVLVVFAGFSAQAAITGVAVEPNGNGGEVVKFLTTESVEVGKSFTLDNPSRVVVDVPRVSASGIHLPKDYAGGLLKAIRFGQFNATTSRIVLDVAVPTKVSTTDGAPFLVELSPTGPVPKGKAVVTDKTEKRPLVVIDAGHGGQDPGAIGLHRTQEKNVTLNFARALREALLNTGRYRVKLTRDDDRFVQLSERVEIARRAKADIFISFHADSNPRPEARGLSVYTLSETASDAESAALAERENKADIIPGLDLNTTDEDVASILIDLTQRETMNKSSTLADQVVASLHGKINKLPGTHRFAGFRVLKGPDIPSVLIELGFLSNATDERLLLSPDYRDMVVQSVAKGIDRYRAGE